MVVLVMGKAVLNKDGSPCRSLEHFDHTAYEISRIHGERGGCTFHPIFGDQDGVDGWAVAVHPELEEKVEDCDIPEAAIIRFCSKVQALLCQYTDYCIGTWYDEEEDKSVIDLAKIVKDPAEAIELGKLHNQDAIWHLGRHEELRLK